MAYPLLLFRRNAVAAGSIDYDFTGGSLPSGTTLTRSSTATYFNSSGVLTSAAVDAARFEYNPATLALRGLLIEPQATNEAYPSNDFSAWTDYKAGITVTANAATSPDGASNATKLTLTTSTGEHKVGLQKATTVVATRSSEIYAKAGTANYVNVFYSVASSLGSYSVTFSLVDGSFQSQATKWSPDVTFYGSEYVGDGWWRFWVGQDGETGMTAIVIGAGPCLTGTPTYSGASPSFTGDGASYIYVFGGEMKQETTPTSYIPTTSAAVTRAADQLSFTVPGGVSTLRYTFDDNTTQDVSVSPGAYTVPTNLNRAWIKRIQSV